MTYAVLEVSQATYDEISGLLQDAGYRVERDGFIKLDELALKSKAPMPRPKFSLVSPASFKAAGEVAAATVRAQRQADGQAITALADKPLHGGYPESSA